MIHRNFDPSVQVLAGAARVSGPVPLGGGSYLLGGAAWPGRSAAESNIGVTDAIVIRTGVDYIGTSYFDPSLTLRGQRHIRSTASIVYSFLRRSRARRLA
jgi:hypothetical protein